mgnify:CR=1 FL=1
MKIILATTNSGKLKEFIELSKSEPWLDIELAPPDFAPEETGKTFFENARIKATTAATMTGVIAVADDSGLVVEALNGRPGVQSARYCEGTDADRRAKLLKEMENVKPGERQAAYFCAMVISNSDGTVAFNTIRCWEGIIGYEEQGENGFGFDPVFFLPKKNMTAAQIAAEEKNRISHRGQAWAQIIAHLKKVASTSPDQIGTQR